MSLQEKQRALIEDLNHLPDPHERLGALAIYVSQVALPQEAKAEELLVPGCVSRVWLDNYLDSGRLRFRCAADSPMVAGLVALLCYLYDNATPEEVIAVEPDILHACGLTKILSPTRMNGLNAVRRKMIELARNATSPSPRLRGEGRGEGPSPAV